MENENKIILPYMEIQCIGEDVVRFTLTRDIYLTMGMAMEMVEACRKLYKGKIYKSLKVVPYRMQIADDVLTYLASDARKDMISCEAVVVKSATLKFLGNFYLRIKRPMIKTRVFDTELEAMKWLAGNGPVTMLQDAAGIENKQTQK